jgi:dethiobiotin synthetase
VNDDVSGRPERVVLVTGTGTEVGKTWVACRLAVALRDRDLVVAARKPVMSYDPDDDPLASDAVLLARATDETPEAVCAPHRWYPVAMAPPMAAEALGRPGFTVEELVGEIVWPAGTAVGIVEGAGGVLSPLADDGDAVTLAEILDRWPITVVLNRYDALDDIHRRNRAWLVDRDGYDVVISAEQVLQPLLGWS